MKISFIYIYLNDWPQHWIRWMCSQRFWQFVDCVTIGYLNVHCSLCSSNVQCLAFSRCKRIEHLRENFKWKYLNIYGFPTTTKIANILVNIECAILLKFSHSLANHALQLIFVSFFPLFNAPTNVYGLLYGLLFLTNLYMYIFIYLFFSSL